MQRHGRPVVRPSRRHLTRKRPQMVAPSLMIDPRVPFPIPLVPRHPLVPRRPVPPTPLIPPVFASAAQPQVDPHIVQPVVVDVVAHLARPRVRDDPVHPNLPPTLAPHRIKRPTLLRRAPLVLHQIPIRLRIDPRELALRQRNPPVPLARYHSPPDHQQRSPARFQKNSNGKGQLLDDARLRVQAAAGGPHVSLDRPPGGGRGPAEGNPRPSTISAMLHVCSEKNRIPTPAETRKCLRKKE